MAEFSGEGATGGAISGATAGAGIGTMFGPGPGTAIGAGIGGTVGLLAGGFFGGRKKIPDIDISAELARIAALYEQARVQGRRAITQDYQAQRGELASEQAARGIYRSPVSQRGLEALGAARSRALAQFESGISGQEAGTQSSILQALMGQRRQNDLLRLQQQQAQQNAILGGLSSVGSALLFSRMGQATPGARAGQGVNYANTGYMAPDQNFISDVTASQPPTPYANRPNPILGLFDGRYEYRGPYR